MVVRCAEADDEDKTPREMSTIIEMNGDDWVYARGANYIQITIFKLGTVSTAQTDAFAVSIIGSTAPLRPTTTDRDCIAE